jgi:hypothetical protein
MPMMTPVGTGHGAGGSSYGSAATTTDGTSNNRTPKRALAKGFGGRQRSAERKQN